MKIVNDTIFLGDIMVADEADFLMIDSFKLIKTVKVLNKTFRIYVYYRELNFDLVQALILRDQRLSIKYKHNWDFSPTESKVSAFKNMPSYMWVFELKLRTTKDIITYSLDEFNKCKVAGNSTLNKFHKKYEIKNIEFLKKFFNSKYEMKINEIL